MGFRAYKGNTVSENGWRICDTAEIVKPLVPGTDGVRPEVRRGPAATILVATAALFHKRVRRIDRYKPRDYWGFSWENVVPNSNHLAGTAVDLIATELPWKRSAYSGLLNQREIEACRGILRDMKGGVFWGEDWGTKDPMHWQLNWREGDPRVDALAAELSDGYLGVFAPEKPRDPSDFPLPLESGPWGPSWFFGPLEGPSQSISGQFATDPPEWREALKRWQTAAGVPSTGVWDQDTARAGQALQIRNGWQSPPGNGYIYEGEWNAVMKHGQKPELDIVPKAAVPVVAATSRWADVSQYQRVPIDDSYPHRIFCFRTNSGDREDTIALENCRRAKAMLDSGKLDIVIPYWFLWPGQANVDLHRDVLERGGLWLHPKTASMADVEDAGGKITVDMSGEANDEIARLQGWYGDKRRVIGYWNPVANPDQWRVRPPGLRLVVPSYGRTPGQPMRKPEGYFAHQFSDAEPCPPFGRCDGNYADMSVTQIADMLGITPATGDGGIWDEIGRAVGIA